VAAAVSGAPERQRKKAAIWEIHPISGKPRCANIKFV